MVNLFAARLFLGFMYFHRVSIPSENMRGIIVSVKHTLVGNYFRKVCFLRFIPTPLTTLIQQTML